MKGDSLWALQVVYDRFKRNISLFGGGSGAQAVRRSLGSHVRAYVGHSMWVSWWTKLSLGRFFSGFLPFSPDTNSIPLNLHTHLIHLI